MKNGGYYKKEQKKLRQLPIEGAFPFLQEKGHIVSLVGAGGKTSLLYAMAEYCCRQGMRTIVMTTTHMQKPDRFHWAGNKEWIEYLWKNSQYAVLGEPVTESKIGSPNSSLQKYILGSADMVLIEADGARHCPCKVPAAHEPVIMSQSDIVVAVLGMRGIGEPAAQVCFRLEEAKALLDISAQHLMTAEDYAEILTSPNGSRKQVEDREYYMVLNQCDTEADRKEAMSIINLLPDRENVVLSHFEEDEQE